MILSYITRRISTLIAILPVLLIQITALASPALLPYRVFFSIPPTWDLTTYDPTVTLYQATQSITFEPGYTTPAGANLVAEIVPGGFGVPQATNLTGTADANINWISRRAMI
jgi:hypothetical protein